jgi:hypothetical protein
VSDDLHVGVTNLPGQAPQRKPLIECNFKLIHTSLKDIAPAYEPPHNVKRRCGKHYEKDACLTVREIGTIILNAIILHNRRCMLDYNLSLPQIARGVPASPIDLWNDGVAERSGLLTRFSEAYVRSALLTKDVASVTDEGILFRGCYYACQDSIARKWFVRARHERFKINVGFDSRLVDTIHIYGLLSSAESVPAFLTTRSEKYRSMALKLSANLARVKLSIRALRKR